MSANFHPDLRRLALVTPRKLVGPRSLPVLRRLTAAQRHRACRDVEVLTLPSGAEVRLHRPPQLPAAAPALLWIHGGGYVLGTAAQDDRLCRRFSRELGITVAAVDYRLAPEHRYPAALEDCHAALSLVAGSTGVDAARVAIGGASAGGGLAAALALMARDRGGPAPVLQLLVYPMLDDRSGRLDDDRHYRLWNPASNRFGWAAYLGDADPQVAVPARRADLAGLPPARWICSTPRAWPTPNGCGEARCRASFTRCPAPSRVSICSRPGAAVSRSFFAGQCARLRRAFAEQG